MEEKIKEEMLETLRWREELTRSSFLGNFVIQQNEIQSLLTALVIIRADLVIKKWVEWLEEATLGTVIGVYQSCAHCKEVRLLTSLRDYNKRRNYIIHKIKKVGKDKSIEKYTAEAFKLGNQIKKNLYELIEEKGYRVAKSEK